MVALAPEFLRLAPDAGTLALSLAPPVVVGFAVRAADRGALGPGRSGCCWAPRRWLRRTGRRRAAVGRSAAWWLGLAQAAALVPGVSRTGATLAAAALGYSRAEASRLSFGVAGPVLAGATALKAWRPASRLGLRRVRDARSGARVAG